MTDDKKIPDFNRLIGDIENNNFDNEDLKEYFTLHQEKNIYGVSIPTIRPIHNVHIDQQQINDALKMYDIPTPPTHMGIQNRILPDNRFVVPVTDFPLENEKSFFDRIGGDVLSQVMVRRTRHNRISHFEDHYDKGKNVYLALGDSWFQYFEAQYFTRATRCDILGSLITNHTNNVYPFAVAGNTVQQMQAEGQAEKAVIELKKVIGSQKPIAGVILSIGGNDITSDNLLKYVMPYEQGRNVTDHIYPNFEKIIDDIMQYYRTLFDLFICLNENIRIVVHGYSYVRPCEHDAQWIRTSLCQELGFPDEVDKIHPLIHKMLNIFNDMLQRLAEGYGNNVRYVDLRSHIDTFQDEMHPDEIGCDLAARLIYKTLIE